MRADNFFQALRSYWTTLPPGIQESFLAQVKELMALEDRLRKDPALAAYDQEIYPELRTLLKIQSPGVEPRPREVLHLCTQQIQIMGNVFLALDLAEYHAHPLNRGWMNLFRRWTAAPTMRLLWPSLKSLHNKDFVSFAEYQLNLSGMRLEATAEPQPHSIPLGELFALRNLGVTPSAAVAQSRLKMLFQELGQEWPMSPIEFDQQVTPREAASIEDYSLYFEPFSRPTGVWTISHPHSTEEIWGIAVLADHPENVRYKRLMVWVRPAYRGVTLGTKLLDAVLVHITEPKELVVVLPPLRRDKPGYGDEMAGWLRFYGRKGFVRITSEKAQRLLNWDKPFDLAAFCLVMPEAL